MRGGGVRVLLVTGQTAGLSLQAAAGQEAGVLGKEPAAFPAVGVSPRHALRKCPGDTVT